MQHRPRTLRLLALLLGFALVAAACSSDGQETAESSTTTEPGDSQTTDTEPTTTEPSTTAPETTTTEAPAPEPITVEFDSGACEFAEPPGFTSECGWVEVPQHWDDPADPDTISLHVATFTSDATPADAVPVVYLEGGPGGDVFGLIELSLEERWGALIDAHPLIMFSQRGSALTDVDLECEELIDSTLEQLEQTPDAETEGETNLAALLDCADRLRSEGADLSAYHTTYSARDADAIRQALGHETWNVLGLSYGTRLGQELVRNHPEPIQALILDSVQPTDPRLGSLAAIPGSFQNAAERLFAGCESSDVCSTAFPNLEERLRAVVAQADQAPFEFEALDPLTAESYDVIVDDTRLMGTIFQALYSPEMFAAIPEMVEELEAGETNILASFVGLQIANAPFISWGMYAAVMCHDFVAELTPADAYDAGLTGDPLFDEVFDTNGDVDLVVACDELGTGSAPATIIEPVETDVPTLILAGEYDPITPPSFAEAIAPGFSNGQLTVLPHVAHGVVGDDCGMEIALGFLADPDSPADTSCIATSVEPSWAPASLAGTEFEPFEDSTLGVAGVIPAGWLDQGFGVSVRSDSNLAHQSVLIQQVAPIPPAQLLTLLSSQFGGEPVEAGAVDRGGRSWTIYETDSALGQTRFYVATDGPITLLVGLIGSGDDIEDMAEHVAPTVLESITRT